MASWMMVPAEPQVECRTCEGTGLHYWSARPGQHFTEVPYCGACGGLGVESVLVEAEEDAATVDVFQLQRLG